MQTTAKVSLEGFVRANNGLLFIEDRHCIVRQEDQSSKKKVKLIAGGRCGHDPAFHGYVGKGMLDGAVFGRASGPPQVRSIVDCLRIVAGPNDSVLFIVNNYFADRLRFGLAVEQARSRYGFKNLEILLNDDDCAFEESETRKPLEKRGLAGCVVLIKILGAMAEQGHPLDRLKGFGDEFLRTGCIATVGWTFDVNDDGLHNIELGAGPHMGQKGVRTNANLVGDVQTIVDSILEFAYKRIISRIVPRSNKKVAVFVNNLGGTPEFVMRLFVDSMSVRFAKGYTVERVYEGNFFSYPNKAGLSLTVVNLQYSEKLLDYEVQVSSTLFGGLPRHSLAASKVLKFEDEQMSKASVVVQKYKLGFDRSDQLVAKDVLKQISKALLSQRDVLNDCGKKYGTPNAGDIIATGVKILLERLESHVEFHHPAKMFQDLTVIMQQGIGNIGSIYGLFLQGASNAFAEADKPRMFTTRHWLQALTNGVQAVERYTLFEVNDLTLVDVLRPAEEGLRSHFMLTAPDGSVSFDGLAFVKKFADLCEEKAEDTKTIVPRCRQPLFSSRMRKRIRAECEYPEPGAHAVKVWANAWHMAYKRATSQQRSK